MTELCEIMVFAESRAEFLAKIQQMLEILNVKGKIITADAMHCQRET